MMSRTVASEAMFPRTKTKLGASLIGSKFAMHEPSERLSRQTKVTSGYVCTMWIKVFEPMKPAPPV
eukprot:CAMPEP_0115425640 /NCGR_PEP_ID=MMETSP0271-20121206/28488_1 /TAXON_ID=71861 /ORGANISM="Scrippsiella trochoidea, Strain CCMP3099" /LENGTH=65 /DNA_ID=CAMNT_0002850553 /DNA_START=60 /DNA_END=253 /DNA_ORIENTATION=+